METDPRTGPRAWAAATLIAALVVLGPACGRGLTPEERSFRLEQGDEALSAGDLAGAERAFDEVVTADPENARALFGLGLARLRLGRIAEALTLFEKTIRIDPNNPDPLYLRAHTLQRLGRTEEAIDAFRSLVEAHPDRILPTLEMLGALVDAGRLEEARLAAEKALLRWPNQFNLNLEVGRIRALMDDSDGAIAQYARARQIRPYAPQPVYGLIEVHRKTGRLQESLELMKVFEDLQQRQKGLEAMRQEADRTPGEPGPFVAYVDRLFAEGHLDEGVERTLALLARFPTLAERRTLALRAARAALTVDLPDMARDLLSTAASVEEPPLEDLLTMAEVHEGLGEFKKALAIYDRCLLDASGDHRALLGLGRTAIQAGDLAMAEPALRRALALTPDDAGGRAALGLLLIKKGDPAGGLAELKTILQSDPDQPDALFGLAFLAHQRGDDAAAERYLRTSLARRPSDPSAVTLLALLLANHERCEEAIPLLTRAAEADAENPTLRAGLVRCLEATGRTAEAARQREILQNMSGARP